MRLAVVINRYARQHPCGLSSGTVQQLHLSAQALQNYLGRPVDSSKLSCQLVNKYLLFLRESRSPDTFRTRRGNLLTIWKAAHSFRAAPKPGNLLVNRAVRRSPRCWSLEELRKLIETADSLPGCFRGTTIPKSPWWGSYINAGYDTALRLSDLLALSRQDIQGGIITVVQQKTGHEVSVGLRDATREKIEENLQNHSHRLIWPLWGRRRGFFLAFQALVRAAGITKGTSKWLRRTAITHLERVSPGAGTVLAGHRYRSTTERHYIDLRFLGIPPLPPDVTS